MQHSLINHIRKIAPSNRRDEKLFSISDLERFSGIKTHTIRVWEHRYGILSPLRSDGNVRLYTIDHVRRLLSVALLQNNRYRLSSLGKLTDDELEQKVQSLHALGCKQLSAVNHLVFYMYSDIEKFEDVLDGCVNCWGIDNTIENIIIPFLGRVQLVSYRDKKSETHFAVAAIRKKIMVGIEKQKILANNPPLALLFLPEKEHYDLLLLYMTYLLRRTGTRVLYLGTDISINNLHPILQDKKPDFLYTYITDHRKSQVADLAAWLQQQYQNVTLHVVTPEETYPDNQLDNVQFIHYQSFNAFINSM